MLSLPLPAHSEDTVVLSQFRDWIVKHIETWFAFTQRLGLGVDRMEEIVLVTGRHLTKSWINVAFHQHQNAGVTFNTSVSDDCNVHLERVYVDGAEMKLGPTGRVRSLIS